MFLAAFDASIISAAAMIVVAIIEAVAARDRKRVKQERAQLAKQQQLQEQLNKNGFKYSYIVFG